MELSIAVCRQGGHCIGTPHAGSAIGLSFRYDRFFQQTLQHLAKQVAGRGGNDDVQQTAARQNGFVVVCKRHDPSRSGAAAAATTFPHVERQIPG